MGWKHQEWNPDGFAQLHYRPDSSDWSLHWADRNSRWHPYDPEGFHLCGSAAELLDEIDRDPTAIFKGWANRRVTLQLRRPVEDAAVRRDRGLASSCVCPSDHDRPRERLLALGADALTDAELVALHLSTGRRGEGVLGLAQSLLDEWGGIAGLGRTQLDELMRTPGVGQAKACRLVAAFALADRSTAPEAKYAIRTSADVAAVAIPRIGRERVEKVLVLVLDGQHRVRRTLMIGQGGATTSLVPVREVLGHVLRHDGIAFALAHNHPSGSLEPSAEDLAVTNRLRDAAKLTGLRFLDHVIVSGDRWRGLSASQ